MHCSIQNLKNKNIYFIKMLSFKYFKLEIIQQRKKLLKKYAPIVQ